jgi:hypothetical protein
VRPLKITATLNNPIAGDVPMLDAILECAMSRRMEAVLESSNGHRHLTRTRNVKHRGLPVNPGAIPIPIDRARVSGFPWPIPRCSSPIFIATSDGVDHFARRFDVDPALIAPGQRRVFQSGAGEFKSYRLPLRIRGISKIVWFAMGRGRKSGNGVGNCGGASEIRKLLKRVTQIGKKGSIGYGQVSEWKVEPMDEDWSWFAPSPAGPVLMRPLPMMAVPDEVVGARRWFGGLVAPYWSSEFFAEGYQPC